MGKRIMIAALLWVLLWNAAAGQEDVKVGQIYRSYKADLNTDGRMERVELRVFAKKEGGWFGTLLVKDSRGSVLWKGPEEAKTSNRLVFGSWDYGSCIPEVIGDIDGDGKIELVSPEPQSDVRPTTFRVLRWESRKFSYCFSKCLLEKPENSGSYPWQTSDEYMGRWISRFKKLYGVGTMEAEVLEFREGSNKMGTAVVTAVSGGFQVMKWKEPLKAY